MIMRKMNSVTVHELRATITGEAVSAKPSGIPPARLRDCVRGVSERNHAEAIGCSSFIVDGSPSIERARAFSRRRRSPPPRQCREFRATSSLSEHSSGKMQVSALQVVDRPLGRFCCTGRLALIPPPYYPIATNVYPD